MDQGAGVYRYHSPPSDVVCGALCHTCQLVLFPLMLPLNNEQLKLKCPADCDLKEMFTSVKWVISFSVLKLQRFWRHFL